MFDALRQAETRLSTSGKSLVIEEGWNLFFTEMKELDAHLQVYDGGVLKGGTAEDAVISIKVLQAFEDAVSARKTAEQFDVTWDDLDNGGATD